MAAAQAAENHGDEWELTWYLIWRIDIYIYIYICIYKSFIVTYIAVTIADREIRSIFYTKAFHICSSECNFSTARNKFVAFT